MRLTKEQINLLFTDISARLPYGLIFHTIVGDYKMTGIIISNGYVYLDCPIYEPGDDCFVPEYLEECRPYLRSMLSMTPEESNELFQLAGKGNDIERMNFYYSHYLDINSLIPKGLAIEALPGMYT